MKDYAIFSNKVHTVRRHYSSGYVQRKTAYETLCGALIPSTAMRYTGLFAVPDTTPPCAGCQCAVKDGFR